MIFLFPESNLFPPDESNEESFSANFKLKGSLNGSFKGTGLFVMQIPSPVTQQIKVLRCILLQKSRLIIYPLIFFYLTQRNILPNDNDRLEA